MKTSNARLRAQVDEDIVVFLIGLRINRLWKIHKWLPTALAMPKMIRELQAHPELGFLGAESWGGRTTIMVQYWRSREALYAYAKMRDSQHLPAWRAFNKRVGSNGDVGIWHETFAVDKGGVDSIYVNMPAFGLGRIHALGPAHRQAQGPDQALAKAV